MMKTRSMVVTILFLVACAAVAQTKQPITHEAMFLMKRVGAPVVSPDGKWAVFSVTEPSYDEKEQVTDLWVVPTDGSAKPRRVTSSKAGEGGPAWSPDSRRIAFSAKRDGDEQNQLYVLDLIGGGEAQRVTNVSTGAYSPQFRPDGKALLFASTVYPGALDDEANKKAAKEEKDRKYKVRAYDSFPIRNWDRWLDEKQAHLMVQPLNGVQPGETAKAKDLLAGTQLVAAPGFGGSGGGEGRESISGEWSPDGQWVVFVATTGRHTGAYSEVAYDLYRVPANGGEPERIATAEGGYGGARFSPDGKTLYASFNPNNGKTYNNTYLVAFDWPSMQNRRRITNASFDRSVGGWTVTNDGRTIYLTAEDAGHEKIYTVPATGGDVQLFLAPERGVYTDLQSADDAPVLLARWGSSVDPQEIVRIDTAGKRHRALTDFTVEDARKLDWQAPQHFWFTSKRGRKIHNMVVLPANFDASKKYPLFVLIHGGAHNMWRDQISLRWNYHLLARPGYVMLMTNYTGSTGFGEQFAQAIMGDPLRGPADELNEAADEAIRRYPFIDASRQVAGGASYGGHLANALQAWGGNRYKALISHAGLINLETQWGTSDTIFGRELAAGGPVWEQGAVWREQNPIRYAANFKTPVLVTVGEKDFRVPLNNTLEYWSVLQRLKVPSRLLVFPEENHWILNGENSRIYYKEVHDWIAKWIDK
ncbi:MAG TPA: S9 family peptidase [Thermoanaerobaculia bacterium]|jgi:dipeptidyl aminopeptidase/acylaminoacyl peptidase